MSHLVSGELIDDPVNIRQLAISFNKFQRLIFHNPRQPCEQRRLHIPWQGLSFFDDPTRNCALWRSSPPKIWT